MAIAGHRLFYSALFYSSGNRRDNLSRSIVFFPSCLRCKTEVGVCSTPTTSTSSLSVSGLDGGKVVVELVGAFNDLMERMGVISTTSASELLFKSLKLCIPLLRSLPYSNDNRSPLSRALSVACLLADLQMDAEVISAGLLREAFEAGVVTMHDVKVMISASAAHLLHESLRLKNLPSKVDVLDDESANVLRKFCLTFYDIRAVILDLVLKLDTMRHIHDLPRYRQLILSLEVMKIYAPLSHAVGAGTISLELEDIALQYLLPNSYQYVDAWLKSFEGKSHSVMDACRDQLLQRLKHDSELEELVDDIKIEGRYKSRYSTMKKLLRDGRSPEEVNDLLGLRVILNPKPGDALVDRGLRAVYRTFEVVRIIWKEVPNKSKDYVSKPKENGYRSLHVVVDVCGHEKAGGPLMEIQIRTKEMDMVANAGAASHSLYKGGLTDPKEVSYSFVCTSSSHSLYKAGGPLMEIQIRTKEMDMVANAGAASHSLYKGGLTDPKEAKQLKTIMLATAELAAFRLRDPPVPNYGDIDVNRKDRAFQLLDKDGDGQITIEELSEEMEELGADGKDAEELMQILDANSDGSLSSDEFDSFQKQIELMRNFEDKDHHYKALLGGKLQMTDPGLIQVYRKELGDKLVVNNRVHRGDHTVTP